MDTMWTEVIWRQFGAAMDMFQNALRACPDELWSGRLWKEDGQDSDYSEFWYVAYHTLFWLDLYLSGSVEGFNPPAPFTLGELDPAGVLPDRVYSREELFQYLAYCREKGDWIFETLTDEKARRLCKFTWGEVVFAELQLYNMRHVQEHGAQLNLFIGQEQGSQSRWVTGTGR